MMTKFEQMKTLDAGRNPGKYQQLCPESELEDLVKAGGPDKGMLASHWPILIILSSHWSVMILSTFIIQY